MDVLSTFNKLPALNTGVVLFVGSQGVGKHQLARTMVDNAGSLAVQCRTATSLPLPPENSSSRPRIDLVVFVVDLTNRHSFTEVDKSFQHLDNRYFVGRTCLVATPVKCQSQQCVEVERVTQLTDSYDCPLVWTDLEDDLDRTEVANKLLHMLSVAAGLTSNVTPLLLDSTKSFYETQTL